MGGNSKEREISMKTGQAILESLQRQGYQAIALDTKQEIAAALKAEAPAATVIALHGHHGEDGTIQGLLEILQIPYSGSGVLASALCMDKRLCKQLVATLGVTVPEAHVVHDLSELQSIPESLPVVVKPNQEGSTLGMAIVREAKEIKPAVTEALQHDSTVLLEQYIAGTEVTVGLMNGQSLPVLEIVPQSGFYDFEAKYTKGMTEYIVPARIPEAATQKLQQESEMVFQQLNLSGIARIDYILAKNGTPYFLEINTIPGMTETSLVPKAAEKAGINFDQVVEAILESCSLKI